MKPIPAKPGYHPSTVRRVFDASSEWIDHQVGWDRLPKPLGLLVLLGLRDILRRRNLYDTSHLPGIERPALGPPCGGSGTTRW